MALWRTKDGADARRRHGKAERTETKSEAKKTGPASMVKAQAETKWTKLEMPASAKARTGRSGSGPLEASCAFSGQWLVSALMRRMT